MSPRSSPIAFATDTSARQKWRAQRKYGLRHGHKNHLCHTAVCWAVNLQHERDLSNEDRATVSIAAKPVYYARDARCLVEVSAPKASRHPNRRGIRLANPDNDKKTLADLIDVMAALRTPETGCPWDLKQTFETIAPYTIEEAYEVADAIARANCEDLKDELGDLLLQVVYHARIAQEGRGISI